MWTAFFRLLLNRCASKGWKGWGYEKVFKQPPVTCLADYGLANCDGFGDCSAFRLFGCDKRWAASGSKHLGLRLRTLRPRNLALVKIWKPVCDFDGAKFVWRSYEFHLDLVGAFLLANWLKFVSVHCSINCDCSRSDTCFSLYAQATRKWNRGERFCTRLFNSSGDCLDWHRELSSRFVFGFVYRRRSLCRTRAAMAVVVRCARTES